MLWLVCKHLTIAKELSRSVRSHHIAIRSPVPALPLESESWANEIVARLPATLDAQARTLQAFQRIRGVACPTDLLRAILAYVLDASSFRLLGGTQRVPGGPPWAGQHLGHRLAQATALC
jgi:hypothetical protein